MALPSAKKPGADPRPTMLILVSFAAKLPAWLLVLLVTAPVGGSPGMPSRSTLSVVCHCAGASLPLRATQFSRGPLGTAC